MFSCCKIQLGSKSRSMIISFIIAIPLIALSVWFYLKVCQSGTTLISRLGFEMSVLTVVILGCILVSYYSYSTVGQGTDSAWWPVIAFIYCFVLIPSILILAAITRKLIYINKIKTNCWYFVYRNIIRNSKLPITL